MLWQGAPVGVAVLLNVGDEAHVLLGRPGALVQPHLGAARCPAFPHRSGRFELSLLARSLDSFIYRSFLRLCFAAAAVATVLSPAGPGSLVPDVVQAATWTLAGQGVYIARGEMFWWWAGAGRDGLASLWPDP